LADRLGLKTTLIGGLLVFAAVYAGMAFNQHPVVFWGLFLLYGVYAAATEGIAKAWISNVVPRAEAATALGTFAGFASICTLIASAFTGLLWQISDVVTAFSVTAVVTLGVAVYLGTVREQR